MPLIIGVFLILALLFLCFAPAIWAKHVLRRNGGQRCDFPGTGGELAQHLLRELRMPEVRVEEAQDDDDHYDSGARAVRLRRENLQGRSLTAIVVAAHEVGHAIQDRDDDPYFRTRGRMAHVAALSERLGVAAMIVSPVCGLLAGVPAIALLVFLAGFLLVAATALLHLVTLPVEWDASFNKALPILADGGYLQAQDLTEARRILKACAFTYVASSLSSLLNFTNWLRVLLR